MAPTISVQNRHWFVRHDAARSASDAVDRMLLDAATAMSGAWLVVVAVAMPPPEAGLRVPLVGWLVLAAAGAAWMLCLLVRWAPRWIFVVTTGAGLVVLAAFTAPEYWSGASPVIATWAKMAAVCAAPLLQERRAIAAVVSMGLALTITIAAVGVSESVTSSLEWRGGLFAAVAGIALGMAAVGIVGALRRIADESDVAASEAQEALALQAHDQARSDEADRFVAVIHDGLINTLGAVARGSAERNRSLTIERCQVDANAMRSFLSAQRLSASGGAGPRVGAAKEIADQAQRRARLLGLDLAMVVGSATVEVPQSVVAAICSVVDEALLNVSKHSGSRQADFTVEGGLGWVRIEILDEGNGFDLVATGQPQGIAGRCRRLGIALAIETSPGAGTSVRLDWREPPSGGGGPKIQTPRSISLLERAHRQMVRSLCGWIIGLFVAQTVASWGLAPPAGNLLALALMVPVGVIAIRCADRGRRLSPPAATYLVLTAGIVTYTSAAGAIGCTRLEIAWWGATAGCLCLILLMLLSSVRWIVAGLASYLLGAVAVSWDMGSQASTQATSTCGPWTVPPLLLEAVVVLLVIYLIQPLTARHARTAAKWRVQASRVRQRTAQQAARDEVRQLHGDQALSPALILLDSIVDGSSDPTDPAVEAQCAREERYLRSLIALDPDLLQLGDILAGAVRLGRDRDVEVAIDSGEPVDLPSPSDIHRIDATLRTIVEHFAPGSMIRLALFPEAPGGCLTIMSHQRPTSLPELGATGDRISGTLMVGDLSDEDEFLVELVWRY